MKALRLDWSILGRLVAAPNYPNRGKVPRYANWWIGGNGPMPVLVKTPLGTPAPQSGQAYRLRTDRKTGGRGHRDMLVFFLYPSKGEDGAELPLLRLSILPKEEEAVFAGNPPAGVWPFLGRDCRGVIWLAGQDTTISFAPRDECLIAEAVVAIEIESWRPLRGVPRAITVVDGRTVEVHDHRRGEGGGSGLARARHLRKARPGCEGEYFEYISLSPAPVGSVPTGVLSTEAFYASK